MMQDLLRPSYWSLYSKKLKEKIERPQFMGFFTPKEAEEKRMRLVKAKEGALIWIIFYLLVDESDGIISDVKFQAFGPSSLIGFAEITSELVIRKNYDQVSRLSSDLIDRYARTSKESAFGEEAYSHLNLIIQALDKIVLQCLDIPFTTNYETTPISNDFPHEGPFPNWEKLPHEEKLQLIEEVIEKEIRPYIELDAGGIQILELHEYQLTISYQGSCTSCHSAAGSTLSAIQQILRARIHPELTVIPQF